ncbi:Major Facilitator Superfamily protein [Roseovarius pacificus]|uniref:Major Facilitator Superfamily protein n=1 Tax=Roseovarius pacificus TaxID=337701 RepID=A0A1M7IR69_9RHOB|nr:MFS transporter [Roseovarius pacificus]GGO61425.1 MFS transporter [Roseovarius pacificus]SHM43211.1 Major Facilitator Superfamily protein [Roseovarius pacificus]
MSDTAPERAPLPILTALAAASLTASLGISVASVLLPTLTRSFDVTVSQAQWVVLAYLMAVTVTIVSAGRLGDLFGHRRVMIAGLSVFIAASVLCATAPSLGLLILGRVLQGVGGAILIALTMSIARDLVPSGQLGKAMGLLGTTSATGTALGPSLGGLVLAWSDWRMAFWLLGAVAGLTLALVILAIRRDRLRERASIRSLDLPGTALLIAALGAYSLATSGGATGVPVSQAVLVVVALAAAACFVMVETRASAPLVPMAVLTDKRTGAGVAMNIVVGTVMMATLVVGPFFLTFSLGLGEAVVGLVLAVGPVVAALSGVPSGWLTDRFGARRVMLAGLMQTMLGLLCLAFLPRQFGVGGYIAALIVLTPAFQLFLAANNTAVMSGASPEQRGRLSGLLGLSRNLGLMTGASAMSTLFVTVMGTGDAAEAPVSDVSHAFSMTFSAAAALALLALFLALWTHSGRARAPADPV